MKRLIIIYLFIIILITSVSAAIMKESNAYKEDLSLGQQIIQFFSKLFGEKEVCDYDCFAPDSLNDTASETIGVSGEKTLQQILTDMGYNINAQNDQTNIQVWNASSDVNLEIVNFGGITAYRHVFGYYLNGNASTFVPLFKNAAFIPEAVPLVSNEEVFNVTLTGGERNRLCYKSLLNSWNC